MRARRGKKFRLVQIASFDARRGCKRCALPGAGVSSVGGRSAVADFWRDAGGRLVIRFSSQGYQEHCEGLRATGEPVADREMDEFGAFVSEALLDWLIEGVDDTPEAFYE